MPVPRFFFNATVFSDVARMNNKLAWTPVSRLFRAPASIDPFPSPSRVPLVFCHPTAAAAAVVLRSPRALEGLNYTFFVVFALEAVVKVRRTKRSARPS